MTVVQKFSIEIFSLYQWQLWHEFKAVMTIITYIVSTEYKSATS